MTHHALALALSTEGVWHEVLNTDAREFGGYGVGNLGMVIARGDDHDGAPVASLTLPALSTIWLRYQPAAHVPTVTKG